MAFSQPFFEEFAFPSWPFRIVSSSTLRNTEISETTLLWRSPVTLPLSRVYVKVFWCGLLILHIHILYLCTAAISGLLIPMCCYRTDSELHSLYLKIPYHASWIWHQNDPRYRHFGSKQIFLFLPNRQIVTTVLSTRRHLHTRFNFVNSKLYESA